MSSIVVKNSHEKQLHCGVNSTIVHTRQRFWIIGVRQLARQYIANCIKCFRYNCRAQNQLMGDYPKERINPSPPFSHVRHCWTTSIQATKDQENLRHLVCLFLHKSNSPGYSEQFEHTRCPTKINSDNGTNFIGSIAYLNKFRQVTKNCEECLSDIVLKLGINWVTIPARTPIFGGI